jgi:hypothetical protein
MPRPTHICHCGSVGWVALTRGFVAMFDPEFAPAVGLWNWFAHFDGRNWYATRTHRRGPNSSGYKVRLHMMVMPCPAGMVTDHQNGNTFDNRLANLRLATVSQNKINERARGGTSKFRGVCRTNTGWRVVIGCNGRQTYLGNFADETEAARAYDAAAVRLHGEFAALNFPLAKQAA